MRELAQAESSGLFFTNCLGWNQGF